MSLETIRQKMNRPELDFIWKDINEGELSPSFQTTDQNVLQGALDVYTAILTSGEYKIRYFIKTETEHSGLYDEPGQIPENFMSLGLIRLCLVKVEQHGEPATSN